MKNLKSPGFLSIMVLILVIAFSLKTADGQTKRNSQPSNELYNAIAHMDSILFDAFNKRDLERLKGIFSTEIEFFHDKGGLTNYDQVIENSKKLFEQNNGLRRELVPGSLEVYPVKDYGAIQTGAHRFCHNENGKEDCGTFKFVHIWQNKDGEWKLTRVISYDH